MHCKICGREVNVTMKKNNCEIFHCPVCNFYFSDAHTTPEYYNQEYWNKHDAGWKERNKKDNLQIHLGNILHYNPRAKKILDFGCGYGDLVEYLRKQGYDAYGCDPFPGLPKKDYLAPDYIPWLHLYDAITMIEVLEHLPDPLVELQKLHECAKKNTAIHIQTWIWNENQTIEKWWYCDPPNHCNYFTAQSMERILTLSGWKVEYIKGLNIVARRKKGANNAIRISEVPG